MCPFAVFGDGDAITLADDCRVTRMSGVEQLALGMRLDANSASLSELRRCRGSGRRSRGGSIEARPYRSVAELDRVSGIGVARACRHPRPSARAGDGGMDDRFRESHLFCLGALFLRVLCG